MKISPEELYMPVTGHTIVPRSTYAHGKESFYFSEPRLSGWLQKNRLSDRAFGMAVYSVFINRITGMKDVIILLDEGRMEVKPCQITLSSASTVEWLLGDISQKINGGLSATEPLSKSEVKSVSGEQSKVTFTYLDQNEEFAGGSQPIGYRNLSFSLVTSENEYTLVFDYDSDAFPERYVKEWAENISRVISAFPDSGKLLSEIDIVTNKESELYTEWNTTECQYEKNLCVHSKLIAQAELNPEKVALFFNDEKMTYRELDLYSNAFANYLIDNNVKPGDRIAVCLERSFGLMVSVFGILKAGAIYMPVSPKFPASRISEILDDATPAMTVTSAGTSSNLPDGINKTDIDIFMSEIHSHKVNTPDRSVSPADVAYIIYTSGTTGKPKGVMIEHHSVLNRIGWMQKKYPLSSSDVLLQKTPVTFDVSVWELFWWSFVGASLVLLEPEGEKSPETILATIKKYGVTIIHFVPSMFSTFLTFLDSIPHSGDLASLKTVFCSGEALTTTIVNDFYRYTAQTGGRARVVNLYGPTEATVDVSYYDCLPEPVNSIPIGKPVDNTGLYVVNESYKLQPLNMPGELLICGVNLARGYFNNIPLTDEKFIQFDLFGKKTRAYRTGDIAYWSNDGNIYYIGRIDSQIKLRGMRIELGEIESKILLCPDIKFCVVLLVNPNTEQSYLAAFYQAIPGSSFSDTSRLKSFLEPHLPEYKIPSLFREIKEIPLSANGKADRKILLSYLTEMPPTTQVSLTNSNEKRVFEIWKRILKKDNFNLTSNFFEIGGNSLLLVQMAILLKKEFGKNINPMTVMQNPTIKALAKFLSDK